MAHYAKKLLLQLDFNDLKENSILDIKYLLKLNPRIYVLNFSVYYDAVEKVKSSMPFRKLKVKISQELKD
ncbi:hypothetical protein [Seonamhaeicola sp. ML3]|uniref:hypothetical protein n=1 Tax=Seonamhaeicola sp. ML3 TaxID=2937786 RepID=UPI002010BC86|nr:hypothetical protein [Seonamhaeicola sp. ML3]